MPITEHTHDFHRAHELTSGPVYLFQWLGETWGPAARSSFLHMLFFYLMLVGGFLSLYLVMTNTHKLQEVRRNVGYVISHERNRKWDDDDWRRTSGVTYM